MMLAPRCFSRVTLVLLSIILSLLLFTALRVHNGIPPTVSITAAQSMVENLAGEWFHLDRQNPDKVSPFTPHTDNGAEEPKPPELLVEGKASRNLARPPELEYLRQERFGLTDTILYAQQCIKPVYDQTIDRNLITNITTAFISDKSTISVTLSNDDDLSLSLPPCIPISLPVSSPYPKAPHPELIFGVASTYSRLSSESTLSAFSHWLSHSKSRLVLTITDYHTLPPSSTLSSLVKLYHSRSILATALPPQQPPKTTHPTAKNYTTPQLHFLLLSTLLSFSTPQTTFLSLIDDDTFFPSLFPLSTALSRYDPSLPLYLGARSESKSANAQYGEMAFGGAGIFVSVPLAKQLVPFYERCAVEAGGGKEKGGDGILRDCVYNYTEARLTEVKGLWQGDLRGDVSGFFEGMGIGMGLGQGWEGGLLGGREERGGGAAGGRGTGKWRGGEREERGGGAAGGRGTGKWRGEEREERGGGAAGGRGTGKWRGEEREERGGGAAGGRGTGKWKGGKSEERGGGAAGGRGTGKWKGGKREERGGGAAGGRGTGKWDHPLIPPRDLQHLQREESGSGAVESRNYHKPYPGEIGPIPMQPSSQDWNHPQDPQHLPEAEKGDSAVGRSHSRREPPYINGGRENPNAPYEPARLKWNNPRPLSSSLPNRIWITITGFFDRVTNSFVYAAIHNQNTTNPPQQQQQCKTPLNPHPKSTTTTTSPATPDLLVRRASSKDTPSSLLSLHHWKSWFHAPVAQMASINTVCGDCFLQRFKTGFGDNTTTTTTTTTDNDNERKGLWVNGYSYTEYSPGSFPSDADLQKVEGTWLYADEGDYDETYGGPLRQRLDPDQKKQWLLVDAYWTGGGNAWRRQKRQQFRQLYVYRAPRVLPGEERQNRKAVDEVLEVVWDV